MIQLTDFKPDTEKLKEGDWCKELSREQAVVLLNMDQPIYGWPDYGDLADMAISDGICLYMGSIVPGFHPSINIDNLHLHHVFLRRAINTFGTEMQIQMSTIDQEEEFLFSNFKPDDRTTKEKQQWLQRYADLMGEKYKLENKQL